MGTGETSPNQNLDWGTLMQIAPTHFVMFQYFKHQIACITMQYKAYQPHHSDRLFTTFQNYTFNGHRITTSGGKFSIIFWRRHEQKIPTRIRQNTPFQVTFFLEEGIIPSSTPAAHHIPLPLSATKPCGSTPPSPHNSSQIYTADDLAYHCLGRNYLRHR